MRRGGRQLESLTKLGAVLMLPFVIIMHYAPASFDEHVVCVVDRSRCRLA